VVDRPSRTSDNVGCGCHTALSFRDFVDSSPRFCTRSSKLTGMRAITCARAALGARREAEARMFSTATKPRLVILGSGWAAFAVAKKTVASGLYEVALVSPRNHM
jgi:hypothetical protein